MLFAHAGCIVSMLKSLKELYKSSKDANALTTAIQTPLKCQKCARLLCLSGYMLRYNDFLHNKMPWSIENVNKHHELNLIQLSAGYLALFETACGSITRYWFCLSVTSVLWIIPQSRNVIHLWHLIWPYPTIHVRMQSGRCYESRPAKIVFSFRILLKRFDPVSSTAFSSVGFRCDSCPLNQPIFHLKFPQALKKTSLCVFDFYESLKCMLVKLANAVLIDHVLHRCQLSALVPAHLFSCIGFGSIFSL